MIKQRIISVLIALISIAILYWTWSEVLSGGGY